MSDGAKVSTLPPRPPEGSLIIDGRWLQQFYDYVQQTTPRGDNITVFTTPRKNGTLISSTATPGEGTTPAVVCPLGVSIDGAGDWQQEEGFCNGNWGYGGGFTGTPTYLSGVAPVGDAKVWLKVTFTPITSTNVAGLYYPSGYTLDGVDTETGATLPANTPATFDQSDGSSTSGIYHLLWARVVAGVVLPDRGCGNLLFAFCSLSDVRTVKL